MLIIAYLFPPEGNAGVYRPLRFVRGLSRMGWRTSVISGKPYRYERYDPELENRIPPETELIRVRGIDPWQAFLARRTRKLEETISGAAAKEVEKIRAAHCKPFRTRIREAVRKAEACWYIPDMQKSWIRPATAAAVKVCTRKHPDVIWATAGPISSWVVAEKVSMQTGIPYVLDLRDPWGLYYYESEIRRPVWARHAFRRIMHRVFKGAQAVVLLYDSVAERYLRAYPDALDGRKIHIIPNGFDGPIDKFSPAPGVDKCTILYTGTLKPYRYDTLLEALCVLKESFPAHAKLLRLLFVGEGTRVLADEAMQMGLSDILETMGVVSSSEVARLQQKAHVLLLLGLESLPGNEFRGSKIFGYLKAGRPILGVLPLDETNKILHRVGVSTVADIDSPSEIVNVLRELLDAWSAGTLASLVPDRAACKIYSAEHQTELLVRALTGMDQ